MNLYQCQKKAENDGFDSMEFIAKFPTGDKKCQWIDAYFGIFKIDGLKDFVMVQNIDQMFPDLICELIDK